MEGLEFRSLTNFSKALLAMQGWRLIQYPNSLVARVLKARCYPQSDFLGASLGNLPSFTWKSIWASRRLLEMGLLWRVGTGENIKIMEDAWIPAAINFKVSDPVRNMGFSTVADLIDRGQRKWKENVICDTFSAGNAAKILQIPLNSFEHDDLLVWKGEASGEYTVRSAYQILLDSASLMNTDESQDQSKRF